jgi:hypothetical protein
MENLIGKIIKSKGVQFYDTPRGESLGNIEGEILNVSDGIITVDGLFCNWSVPVAEIINFVIKINF